MPESMIFAVKTGDKDDFDECASFFSDNYGIWGPHVPFAKPGNWVRMGAAKLKNQLIPDDPVNTVLATCRVGGKLVGHVFSTTWKYTTGT
ncbi:hypothetical protein EVJ58_g9474 [Rhodofomes roseus]|uniref:Uncharacterized protein n=1 Tax=Rhodofomes roseus TaxID=34475 RepID=A0A4Y9XXU4_9APHY|nr:hypothetical protein EVJ58_g9474 [Rhodofomes roseus]